MELASLGSRVTAFLRPSEGANAGLIHTSQGFVVIDTTSCKADMRSLLDAVGVQPSDVKLVINTHSHSDHTWGNQLFHCPILAHERCREIMAANLQNAWQLDRIRAAIEERDQSDPRWAQEMRKKIVGLRITLPTQTFAQRYELDLGGVSFQIIHVNAHTPGSAVVWLPEDGVLFAGDLIFEGRYPFIGDADVAALIQALPRLLDLSAKAIVPGHGRLCGKAQIDAFCAYLQETWDRTTHHIAQGHSADDAASDPGYPRYATEAADRLHETNIRGIYAQLLSRANQAG